MPYTTQYIGDCLHRNWSGNVTSEEIIAAIDMLLQDVKNGQRVSKVLADFSAIIQFDVSVDAVKLQVSKSVELSKLVPKMHVAVIATSEHSFGMVRMWQTYSEQTGWDIATFRNREGAVAWLKTIEADGNF